MRIRSLNYGSLTSVARRRTVEDNQLYLIYPVIGSGNIDKYRDFTAQYFLRQIIISDIIQSIKMGADGVSTENLPPFDVQNIIQSKVERLKEIIQSQPEYKKFKLHIDFVTSPKTLMTLPVIIGTIGRSVPTRVLRYVLATSAIIGEPIYDVNSLKKVFSVAYKYLPDELISLLRIENIANKWSKVPEKVYDILSNVDAIVAAIFKKSFLGKISKFVPKARTVKIVDRSLQRDIDKYISAFHSDLKAAYNAFKVCVDPKAFYEETGIKPDSLSFTITRYSSLSRQVFESMAADYEKYASKFLVKIFSAAIAVTRAPGVELTIDDLISEYKKMESNTIYPMITDELPSAIIDMIASRTIGQSADTIRKYICPKFEDQFSDAALAEMIASLDFSEKGYRNVVKSLAEYEAMFSHRIAYLRNLFVKYFGDSFDRVLNEITGVISSSLDGVVSKAKSELPSRVTADIGSSTLSNIAAAAATATGTKRTVQSFKLIIDVYTFYDQVAKVATKTLSYILLLLLLRLICEELQIVKQEIETDDSVLFEFPNYVLTIDLMSVKYVYHTMVNTSDDIKILSVYTDPNVVLQLNKYTNIDSILNVVYRRLCVTDRPFCGMIVYDEQGNVFYRFQNMTKFNKIKI